MLCGMDRKRIMYITNDIGMTWIVFVYTWSNCRIVVVWNGCKTLRAVSLCVLVRECTNERFDARIRREVDCLTQRRASSECKFNSGFGAGQGTHRSMRELQCEREGQWCSPKAESL